MIFLFAVFLLIGQGMFLVGVSIKSMNLMLVGRVIFGLGGESMNVAGTAMLVGWFKGYEIALALGLNLSLARLGSVCNDIWSPWLDNKFGLMTTLYFGFLFLVLSSLANFLMIWLDAKAEAVNGPKTEVDGDVQFSDFISFGRAFWMLTLICTLLYSAVLPFNNIASTFFILTFYSDRPVTDARQMAGIVMSVLFLVSAIGCPVVGFAMDKIGRRLDAVLIASIIATVAHCAIFVLNPFVSSAMLGLSYTMFASAIFPLIPCTVDESRLGSAYGVLTAMQNTGLFIVPLIVAALQTKYPGFLVVERFFSSLSVIAILFTIALCRMDKLGSGVLNGCPISEKRKDSNLPSFVGDEEKESLQCKRMSKLA